MNYYWLTSDRTQDTGTREECVEEYIYLPRVQNPLCGHELWWDGGSVPLAHDDFPNLKQWASTAYSPRAVTPEGWTQLSGSITKKFSDRKQSLPWIYPGLRLGPARVYVSDTKWHFARIGSSELYSQEIIESFRINGIILPLIQEATLRSDGPISRSYFELVPTRCVDFSDDVSVTLERCAECGIVERLEYNRIVPRLALGDYPDFIRVMPTFTILVSERVKEIVDEKAENMLAISSGDIGIGRNSTPLSELISNARFDKQMQRRRHGR